MTRCFITLVILVVAGLAATCARSEKGVGDAIGRAFQQHLSDVPVNGEGIVTRLLSDDRTGAAHQRFIVALASGQTILIEHNIDVAPRVQDLQVGDKVGFSGEYVWNEQGGLVHWTHHDPAGRHPAGWILHHGRDYR